jgi:hypothetical protein
MESRETDKPIKSGAPCGAEEESLIKRSKHSHSHCIKDSGNSTLSQTLAISASVSVSRHPTYQGVCHRLLIFRRLFDMVYDQDIHGVRLQFQFEP